MNRYEQRKKTEDDEREIVPDGHSIRVSMTAMDSVQQQIANQPAMDERVQHTIAANQATLDAARRNADRAQAFADHYTAEREAQADHSAYGTYCQQLSDAWQQVAA
jgi:hypothetical protein